MRANPLTYGLDGLRQCLYLGDNNVNDASPPFVVCLLISVALAAVLFLLASLIARKRVSADLL
jgi:ABC-type polysaccharide/polyol phosphate export permease